MTVRLRLLRLAGEAARFLLGTCLGLTVDLGLFEAGVRLGAAPGVANVVSAGCAVLVVYLFVTRYVFPHRSRASFVAFVAWYAFSIALFSVLIEVLHGATGWAPFLCKLVSLPFSFAANFGSAKLLFRRSARGPARAPERPGPGSAEVAEPVDIRGGTR